MKVGIMQPYFFPYLGYWQLMNEVDTYVIFDDVSYIKRGWINRNQIKGNGTAQRIGIQIQNASQNKKINELYLFQDETAKDKLRKTLEMAYKKATYYVHTMEILEKVFNCGKDNLAEFLAYGIHVTAEYLEMNTQFIMSSNLKKDETLKAQDKIIDICERLGADMYINAIGGKALYDPQKFAERGIELRFLKMDSDIKYPQGKGEFIPGLSIIDIMMYNNPKEIRELMKRFTLQS